MHKAPSEKNRRGHEGVIGLISDNVGTADTRRSCFPQILKGKYVNLVDLVDRHHTGKAVSQFESLEKLQLYTVQTGKYFPKESAYAGGVLKHLLREILNKHKSSCRS